MSGQFPGISDKDPDKNISDSGIAESRRRIQEKLPVRQTAGNQRPEKDKKAHGKKKQDKNSSDMFGSLITNADTGAFVERKPSKLH